MSQSPNHRPEDRLQTIQNIWSTYSALWFIPGLSIGCIVGFFVGNSTTLDGWFLDGFWAEMLGIFITVFGIDIIIRWRDENNRTKSLQEQLIREAGSRVKVTALTALDMLEKRRWLGRKGMRASEDDLLNLLANQDLSRSNLDLARLMYVDLSNSKLIETNFQGADLRNANLGSADLWFSNLKGASLQHANLQNSDLRSTDLESALLSYADLRGAILQDSNLKSAVINTTTILDETTILPDGSNWNAETDMRKFGVETRLVIGYETSVDETHVLVFEDGVRRHWKRGVGFLN